MTPHKLWVLVLGVLLLCACGGDDAASGADGGGGSGPITFVPSLDDLPAAGNPDGDCDIPAEARPEDTSHPDHVIGTGTPESCTSDAVVQAVAQGGVITFDCGPDPVTITLDQTAKVFNDKGPKIVLDGGGKVALSGGKKVRILYQNTCDPDQVWTTDHCDNQDSPQLTVQNLTFIDGSVKGQTDMQGQPAGGGAIFVSGGRFKLINSRFFGNETSEQGELASGAAVRVFQQFEGNPVYVVSSTFGGSKALGNIAANGGGLSSIGVSYTVLNSLFSYNQSLNQGGGGGGAIYNDGNTYTLHLCGTKLEHNSAAEGGGGIFYVSNDGSGDMILEKSTLQDNPSGKFETDGYPGVFVKTDHEVQVIDSMLTR